MSAIQIQAIPAFADNYLWLIHNSQNAVVVDPGDAAPVQACLDRQGLTLRAILLTHHHNDHIGGVAELLARAPADVPVYGALADQNNGRIPHITQGCREGDTVLINDPALQLAVFEVPGHTVSHIAYYCAALEAVFCGDTLFAGGCGRLFEGTPQQMLTSLKKLAALPGATRVYCAHEYTQSNLRFAVHAEPGNTALLARSTSVDTARQHGERTVPSRLDLELQTNPFLRTTSDNIVQTLSAQHRLQLPAGEVDVFAALREWKNTF